MMKKFLTVLVLGLAVFAVSCGGADLTEFALEAKTDGSNYTVAVSGESDAKVVITVTGSAKIGDASNGDVGTTADTVATTLALGATPTAATTETFLKKLVKATTGLSEFTAAEGITVKTGTDASASNSYETSFEATFTDSAEKTKTVSFTVNIVTGPVATAIAKTDIEAITIATDTVITTNTKVTTTAFKITVDDTDITDSTAAMAVKLTTGSTADATADTFVKAADAALAVLIQNTVTGIDMASTTVALL